MRRAADITPAQTCTETTSSKHIPCLAQKLSTGPDSQNAWKLPKTAGRTCHCMELFIMLRLTMDALACAGLLWDAYWTSSCRLRQKKSETSETQAQLAHLVPRPKLRHQVLHQPSFGEGGCDEGCQLRLGHVSFRLEEASEGKQGLQHEQIRTLSTMAVCL